jgi:NodT family efflux transporter outer membrane factor (OMF) lipoprotein
MAFQCLFPRPQGKRSHRQRACWSTAIGTVLLLGSLSACAEKRDAYDVPSVPLPSQFSQNQSTTLVLPTDGRTAVLGAPTLGGSSSTSEGDSIESMSLPAMTAVTYTQPLEKVLPTWWTFFGSDELNRLVDQALARNPDLHMATLKVEQTEAQFEQVHADEFPAVTLPGSARVDAPGDGTGTIAPGAHVTSDRAFAVGGKVSYRADLWGERRALAEAARLRVWQAVLARDDAQKTLIADLVGTYIDYLALNDRLKVALRSEQVLSEMLSAVRERLDRGDATILDLSQQRAAVRSVQATIPALKLQIAQASHRLAQLTGTTPAQIQLSEAGLGSLKLPQILPGVPSTLLLRRSDVRAAEANLLAADADIDVARAQALPTLDLSTELGKGSNYVSTLLQPESLFWNLVGSLTASLFDHGKREKRIEQQEARHKELVEAYVSAIYGAIRQTEDALARLHFGTQRQLLQQEATDASEEAVQHSRESYRFGATDYMTLLDTERTFHTASDQLFQVTQDRYRGAIDLFVALGGGIELGPRLPGDGARPEDTAPPPDAQSGGVVMSETDGQAVAAPAALQAPADPSRESSTTPPPATVPRPQPKPFPFASTNTAETVTAAADRIETTPLPWARWHIILPGLFNPEGLKATWRSMHDQFGCALDGLSLAPVPLSRQQGSDDLGRDGLKLVIGPFDSQEAAQKMCITLGQQGVRCQSIENGS